MTPQVPVPALQRPCARLTGKIVWAWTALLVSVLLLSPMSAVAVLRAWATDPLSPPPLARMVVTPAPGRTDLTAASASLHRPAAMPVRRGHSTPASRKPSAVGSVPVFRVDPLSSLPAERLLPPRAPPV